MYLNGMGFRGIERNYDDSNCFSSEPLPGFQALLSQSSPATMAFSFPWPTELSAIRGMDALDIIAFVRLSQTVFWGLYGDEVCGCYKSQSL